MKRFILLILTASFYTTIFGLEISDTVMVGENPKEIAVNSVSNKVYVSCNGVGSAGIAILDVDSNKVTFLRQSFPSTIKINEKTNKIYIEISSGIIVVDGKANEKDTSIDLKSSYEMEINPINNFVYVGSNSDSCITEINPLTYQVKYIQTVYCPYDLKINRKTNSLCILHGVDNILSIVNLNTYTIKTIPCGDYAEEFCINELTNKIYVTDVENDNVLEIDGVDYSPTVIPVNRDLGRMEINEKENKIYVLNLNELTIINRTTKTISNIYIGKEVWSIKLNKVTNKVYISCYGGKKIVAVDGKTDQIIDSVYSPLLNAPTEIAINEKTNQIFVLNRSGGGQMPGFVAIINDKTPVLYHYSKPIISNVELYEDRMKIILKKDMPVSIKCINLQGKVIQNKIIEKLNAGEHNIPIFSSRLSKGMYVFQTKIGDDFNSILYKKK